MLEKDKMVFSFLIAAQIQRQKGEITLAEWNLLLRGPGIAKARANRPETISDFVSAAQWRMCAALEAVVPEFEVRLKFCKSLLFSNFC